MRLEVAVGSRGVVRARMRVDISRNPKGERGMR